MKYVEITKQSKKAQKEYYAKNRSVNGFNTGTRTMKTDKKPSRARKKVLDNREIQCYN